MLSPLLSLKALPVPLPPALHPPQLPDLHLRQFLPLSGHSSLRSYPVIPLFFFFF